MGKHCILVECGFGNYLLGKRPKAIANEFLYYNPSLLLLVDQILCDKYAFEGEKAWAEKGYLPSRLFVELKNKNIVLPKDFSGVFSGQIKEFLLDASMRDIQDPKTKELLPPSIPEPDNVADFKDTGFYDVNSILYLSSLLRIPHVDVEVKREYYEWKFQGVRNAPHYQDKKERRILSQVLSIYVPDFELFPKTEEFIQAESSTKALYYLSREYLNGTIDLDTYRKGYSDFLEKWLMYDSMVYNQVLDNFEMLLDLRRDVRLRNLRSFLNRFSKSIIEYPEEVFIQKATLQFKKEILEAEREIAHRFTKYQFLSKVTSYICLPIELASIVLGATMSSLTLNPFFLALSILPSGAKWITKGLEEFQKRKLAWYFYLLDFRSRVDRKKQLRLIEEEIKGTVV